MYVPRRYEDIYDFEPATQEQVKAVNALKNGAFDNVLFVGRIGTGKTHIASYFANVVNRHNKEIIYSSERNGLPVVGYITEYELLSLHDKQYSKSYEVAQDATLEINELKRVDYLILDEIGKREATVKQRLFLEDFLSERYNNVLKNIIISNLNIKQLKEHFGDRLNDRLRDGNLKTVVFTGETLRGKIKREIKIERDYYLPSIVKPRKIEKPQAVFAPYKIQEDFKLAIKEEKNRREEQKLARERKILENLLEKIERI